MVSNSSINGGSGSADLPMKSIGQIAAGKMTCSGIVDVALIQSLNRKGEVKDVVAQYGHIVVGECHHFFSRQL